MRAVDRRTLLPLAGAALLAAFSLAALPFSRGLLRVPRTPYDASEAAVTVPAWVVLHQAAPLVPRGASVVIRSEPPDATNDSYLHRFAVALLPGRKIVPAALWGVPTAPDLLKDSQFTIVVGRPPAVPPGRLLLELPEGSVWRRGS